MQILSFASVSLGNVNVGRPSVVGNFDNAAAGFSGIQAVAQRRSRGLLKADAVA